MTIHESVKQLQPVWRSPPHPHPHPTPGARSSTVRFPAAAGLAGLGAASLPSASEMCVRVDSARPSHASQLSPTLHVPFNSHGSHAAETLVTLLLQAGAFHRCAPSVPPRLRLTAALSVCRGVLENPNHSLMKCLQKVTGWRRRRGRAPTTEEEGGKGVKEQETERGEGKSITQTQLSEARRR